LSLEDMMITEFLMVGQGKIFDLACSMDSKTLNGLIEEITGDNVCVRFALDMPNGVRGVKANFLRSQFAIEPKKGLQTRVTSTSIDVIRHR